MRFLLRSLLGLALFASAIGVVVYGVVAMSDARSARGEGQTRPAAKERVFAADIGVIENGAVRPRIEAFGEIRSWRSLEVRASSGGYIVELSDKFRDGATVEEGEFLFAVDPEDAQGRVDDAVAALEEARADLAEARQAVAVAAQELTAAETQRNLRGNALERREGLRSRGVSTAADVEDAEMAFAAAEQTVASRSQMLLASEVKIERSELRVRRAEIVLANAERELAETAHTAPFSGLLTDVTAVPGGLATPNERLAVLIDPTALEVSFRVTNAQFARLIDQNGALRPTPVAVVLELDDAPFETSGVIDRAGAVIGAGETGRLIYARLDLSSVSLFRPGDFVTVSIDEPELTGVAAIPAAAVTEDGELLIVRPDERLASVKVRLLRRQGDTVIVADAPEGARFVRARSPQLGAGIKVKPLGAAVSDAGGGGADGDDRTANAAPMVELEPDRQKRLIGFVESNERMPTDMKVRVLAALRSGKAPAQMIERIEARMGDNG